MTHRGDFARACIQLWERRAGYGTYNIVNPGSASDRQIAAAVQRILRTGRKFEFGENLDETSHPKAKTHRNNCILDSSKILSTGITMRSLREAYEDSLKKWQPSPQDDEWLGNNQNLSAH